MSDERALLSRRPSATSTRRHPVERGNRARYRARPTAPSAEALDQVGDSTKDVTGGKTMATYVLVHGSNQGGWIWQPTANRLRAAGHQVYAPSLDGCGERKRPDARGYLSRNAGRRSGAIDVLRGSEGCRAGRYQLRRHGGVPGGRIDARADRPTGFC